MSERYLIIGAGPAGISAAESIRTVKPDAAITILTHEPYPFYSRPGIAYLIIDMVDAGQLMGRSADYWEKMRFDLKTDALVEHILPEERRVVLADGQSLSYDRLLVATGASAVAPTIVPGGDLDGVLTFDTLDDAKELVQRASKAQSAVVIGGGITAMEVAEGLAHHGVETHYLLRKDTLWSSLLNETESKVIERAIEAHGVKLHFRAEVAQINGDSGRVQSVTLKSDTVLDAQIVAVCIGVRPQIGMLASSGIEMDRGILVDEYLRTSAANVYAAGDCAQIYDRWSGEHRLDVLWPTAMASGRAAGMNMAGVENPYSKGVSFNAALLFGVHLTAIGQVGAGLNGDHDAAEELAFISRGSSEVWTAKPGSGYASAWDNDGVNTRRIVLRDSKIVGALLVGNQNLADFLRVLIEREVDISPEQDMLLAGEHYLERAIESAWQRWQAAQSGLAS